MTNLIALERGTELAGDYRIERVLGAGGFGITYLADEIALHRPVTIKEYFPSDFAARADGRDAAPRSQDCAGDYKWGLERFIEEAQTLARFSHPNIVRVYRYFRANNTGYMVLHFEEGQSLKSWLKGLGRAPRQKELDAIIAPLLDALEMIHKADFLHRDIAPDNVIIRKDGTPVLIDFGSARGEIASHAKSKTVSALVKPGYSPYEQYAETSRQQGPWTDIYALAATLYHAVCGKRPPDSPSRMIKDELVPTREAAIGAYRSGFLRAIDRALTLQVEARPQSVAQWRGELLAPDPPKQGWFQRSTAGKEAAPREGTAPLRAPPPPDAPGPQGGLLDFVDGLKKAPTAKVRTAAPPPEQKAPSDGREKPVAAGTVKLDSDAKPASLPRFFQRKKKEPEPAAAQKPAPAAPSPQAKNEVIVVKAAEPRKAAKPPRPRRPSSGRSWRPLIFKLVLAAAVASGVIAMQRRIPIITTQGAGVTASQAAPPADPLPLGELRGHTGPVTRVLFSDNGRYIVTTGKDATLRVWSSSTLAQERRIELDDGPATALALSGSRALTGHANGNIVLWDFERPDRITTFKRNDAEVWAVSFLGRSDRFAAASHDWKVALWEVGTPEPTHVIDAHDNAVQATAFVMTPKGPLLATGGADRAVKLWNAETYEKVRSYTGHRDFISALVFSPDGRALASAGLDGNIRLWSTRSRSTLRRLYGHHGRIGGLAFSPTGDALVSAGEDGNVRVWDLRRNSKSRLLPGTSGPQNAATISPDGLKILAAGEDGIVRIWANPLDRPAVN